ncbi:hypothetical protein ABT317_26260 [Streptomyces carpinensis]|uniref:Uncharacterized protein n=1 Tax=Streptomyces carpinensis TaxID=66369 RepID=A0ABV1W870_9ACTN
MTTQTSPAPGADTGLAVHEWLAGRQEPLLDDLAACIARETPSNDKVLLDQGLRYLPSWIGDRYGEATVRRHYDETHGSVAVVDLPAGWPARPFSSSPTTTRSGRPERWLTGPSPSPADGPAGPVSTT